MADIKLEIALKNNQNGLLLNKSTINSISSLGQSNVDPKKIFYGLVENTGSVEILDKNSEIKSMIEKNQIDSSNVDIKIYANHKQVQYHKSTTSTYNDNVLRVQLSDDTQKYKKRQYLELRDLLSGSNAHNLLIRLLLTDYNNIKGLDSPVPYNENETKTLGQYLDGISLNWKDKTIYEKPISEVLEYWCEVTQTNIIQAEDGGLKILLARPIFSSVAQNSIFIPKTYIFENGQSSLFLENKYKKVVMKKLYQDVNNQDYITTETYTTSDEEYLESETFNFEENPFLRVNSYFEYGETTYDLSEYIAKNILSDYFKGLRTKTISVACADFNYYDTNEPAKKWYKGDLLEVGDIIVLENEKDLMGNLIYWRITSREFVFNGKPMLNLELQECFKVTHIDEFSNGLYKNGELVYTWSSLVEKNLIKVQGNEIVEVSTDLDGELTIPSTITSIGEKAFENCDKLTKIEIKSMSFIKKQAFRNCSGLKEFTLPNTNNLGVAILSGNSSLETLTLNTTVDKLEYLFSTSSISGYRHPESLKNVILGNFDTIYYECFKYCSFDTIYISKNVANIFVSKTNDSYRPFYNSGVKTIYCEVSSKPDGWDNNWNFSTPGFEIPVKYGYTLEKYKKEVGLS